MRKLVLAVLSGLFVVLLCQNAMANIKPLAKETDANGNYFDVELVTYDPVAGVITVTGNALPAAGWSIYNSVLNGMNETTWLTGCGIPADPFIANGPGKATGGAYMCKCSVGKLNVGQQITVLAGINMVDACGNIDQIGVKFNWIVPAPVGCH